MESRSYEYEYTDAYPVSQKTTEYGNVLVDDFKYEFKDGKPVKMTHKSQSDEVTFNVSYTKKGLVNRVRTFDSTGRKIGEVTACDTRPAQHTGSDSNGTPVVSDVPGYKTLYVTCSAVSVYGEDGYTVEGVQISSGKRYVLMFPSLYCEGECISISAGSEN